MSDFKAKMHLIRFRLGAESQTPLEGGYSAPPDPAAGLRGLLLKGRKGKGGGQ